MSSSNINIYVNSDEKKVESTISTSKETKKNLRESKDTEHVKDKKERKILVEGFESSRLQFEEAPEGAQINGKSCLGYLEGPAADLRNSTRNDVYYPLELWKMVEKDPDFIEGMETLTIFGEADHPWEEDRIDTMIERIAVVLIKYEIQEENGCVYCKFAILDTPLGRIVKTLCDFGCKLGVSSRGTGDTIEINGREIVEASSYMFVCFDVVITPAVKFARPEYIESNGNNEILIEEGRKRNLSESILKEIENSNSETEVKSIKRIMESIKLPDRDSKKITESLNNKLSSFSSGDNISDNLMSDLEESLKTNEKLTEQIRILESKSSSINNRMKKISQLLRESRKTSRNLRICLSNVNHIINEYEKDLIESADQCDEYSDNLESCKKSLRTESRKISDLKMKNNKLKEDLKLLESRNHKLERRCESFSKRIKSMESNTDSVYESLLSENENLKSKLEESKRNTSNSVRVLKESKERTENLSKTNDSLRKEIKNLKEENIKSVHLNESISKKNDSLIQKNKGLLKENRKILRSYLLSQSNKTGESLESLEKKLPDNYSIEDVDRIIKESLDRETRISSLPISIPRRQIDPSKVSLNESYSYENLSEEDKQTQDILTQMNSSIG